MTRSSSKRSTTARSRSRSRPARRKRCTREVTSARRLVETLSGWDPGMVSSTPASTHARTLWADRPSTRAAVATETPGTSVRRRFLISPRRRRSPGSTESSAKAASRSSTSATACSAIAVRVNEVTTSIVGTWLVDFYLYWQAQAICRRKQGSCGVDFGAGASGWRSLRERSVSHVVCSAGCRVPVGEFVAGAEPDVVVFGDVFERAVQMGGAEGLPGDEGVDGGRQHAGLAARSRQPGPPPTPTSRPAPQRSTTTYTPTGSPRPAPTAPTARASTTCPTAP